MGGGKRSSSAQAPPQPMYFLEGGLLVVGKLLKPDAWVHDEVRTHCNVCVQQFLPFRRRHHCRTCGEVVCGGCSSKREIRQTDVNVHCATRVCTFCMIRATDASIKVHETAMRETLAMDKRRCLSIQPPAYDRSDSLPPHAGTPPPRSTGASSGVGRSKQQLSVWSMESEFTTGSVVQLWPQPIPDDESARLQVARHSVILRSDNDPTMNLLVSIVARTLACPVAFIGILDDSVLWFKASVGWDRTHIPRDDCACAYTLAQSKTLIVPDTNVDKRFHANNLSLSGQPLRYYAAAPIRVLDRCIGVVCALDSVPHTDTSAAMRSTLEAVANIVSEVLEQRVDGSSTARPTNSTFMSLDRTMSSVRDAPPPLPHRQQSMASETASDSGSERSSSTGTEPSGLVDGNASLHGLHVADYASSRSSSDDLEWVDPSPSLYLALSSVPPEYGDKIGVSMDFFQRLQSTLWRERTSPLDGVKAFELVRDGRHFTRSNTKLSGSCAEAVAHVQNYANAAIYENLLSHVVRRYQLSAQTWMDEITFRPNVVVAAYDVVRVLTHARQYPDGSTVVVAVDATRLYDASERDLLFGWFVAPCSLHDGLGAVNASCVVTQPFENQVALEQPNLSCDLLLRLRQCLPHQHQHSRPPHQPHYHHVSSSSGVSTLPPVVTGGHARPARHRSGYSESRGSSSQRLSYHDLMHAPPTVVTVADNQRSHHEPTGRSMARTISEESFGSFSSDSTSATTSVCAKIVPVSPAFQSLALQQRQVSSLNDNERMMLDLLDKTISTQEILAAQQHEMANVIDYHGSQLQRISTAIERVESMLADSGERMKRLPQQPSE